MKRMGPMLLLVAPVGFVLAFVLAPAATLRGQEPAVRPWRGRPALASRGHPGLALAQGQDARVMEEQGQDALATVGPGITVERRGRLLVLTYGSQAAGGGRMSNINSRHEPPGFVVYQGQRPIATGKFEYG